MKDGLGWRNPKGIVIRCIDKIESKKLISEFHLGFCGGHYAARTTAHKILRAGYYWPSIFSDVNKFVRTCQAYQLFTGKQKLAALPLQPVIVEARFQHWGLDFIGKFHENSSNSYSWILTVTDYFTKWVEAIPAKNATEKGNGLAKSSNKNLITIIKKIVGDIKRSCDSKIKYALWANRITKKKATGKSPFELVYGLDVTLPVHLKLPASQLLQHFSTNKDVVQNRIDQIVELDEAHRTAFDAICKNQSNIKKRFDKSSRSRSLQVGDMVLLWDRKNEKLGKHKKFDSLWLGPYIIWDIAGPNSFHLSRLDGEPLDLPANGQMLKLLFKDDI
eukprot:PITA_14046